MSETIDLNDSNFFFYLLKVHTYIHIKYICIKLFEPRVKINKNTSITYKYISI